jgi:hypothetical protein|tara:strand:- start:149 stop:436 length:288 start_codon:yes stop_codon:yes gene_type:complete
MLIYRPDGAVAQDLDRSAPELAPALPVLAGCRIGILDNRKPNADVLLHRLANRLVERTGAIVVRADTKNAALPCEDQVLGLLAEQVDLVLTGTAD